MSATLYFRATGCFTRSEQQQRRQDLLDMGYLGVGADSPMWLRDAERQRNQYPVWWSKRGVRGLLWCRRVA